MLKLFEKREREKIAQSSDLVVKSWGVEPKSACSSVYKEIYSYWDPSWKELVLYQHQKTVNSLFLKSLHWLTKASILPH